MEILLDGKNIGNKKELYDILKKQINSDEFIGNNLDALWEVLSSTTNIVTVNISNVSNLYDTLGDYAGLLLDLFNELASSNEDISVVFE